MLSPHRLALVVFLTVAIARAADALPVSYDAELWAEQDYGNLLFSNSPGTKAFNEWELGGEHPLTMFRGDPNDYPIATGAILWESGLFKRSLLENNPPCCEYIKSIYDRGGALNVAFDLELPGGGIHSGTFSATLGQVVIHGSHDSGRLDKVRMHDGRIDPISAGLLGMPSFRHLGGDLEIFLDFNENDFGQVDRVARTFGYVNIAVPEPSLLALLPLGLGLALARRRTIAAGRISR